MTGNTYQYDPSEMFKEWLQKGGKAQAEFMKAFGSMMSAQPNQNFDPLEALKEMSQKAAETQSSFLEGVKSMQEKGMENLLNLGQVMPKFLSWGAFKTNVGSNGRISIPEAEREALGIKEGDLVQVIVLPLEKKLKTKKEVQK
jgi:AbrB family looped-hinge helix DNA binding protein